MELHEIPFVDEVPRFWFSRRWRLAVFSFVAVFIATSHRVCLDVALISMLNHTALTTLPVLVDPLPISASHLTSVSSLPGHHAHRSSAAPTPRGYIVTSSPWRSTLVVGRRNVTSSLMSSVHRDLALTTGASGVVRSNLTSLTASTDDQHQAAECRNLTDVILLETQIFVYQNQGDLEWSDVKIAGVLDSFFWAELMIRTPAGLLCQRYGGKRVLGFALLVSSLCTVLIPLTSRFHFTLVIVLRFFTGCAAGVMPPAVSYLLGRWSPIEERSLLYSIANTGSYVCGSVIILPLAGVLCQYGFDGGWPSAFYVFGGLGMFWFILWMVLTADNPTQDGGISHEEKEYIAGCLVVQTEGFNTSQDILFPWPAALTSLPVLVLAMCHLTYEMCVYVLIRALPIYFRNSLNLDIQLNTVCALLPGIGFWCMMVASAGAADRLQTYGVLANGATRKLMNTIGAVVTAAMIASLPAFADDCSVHWLGPLALLVVALGFCGVQLGSGSLVAHLDLASRHAGVISGLTGSVGSIAYFVIPSLMRLCAVDPENPASMTSRHRTPTAPPLVPANDVEWRTLFIIVASSHVTSALAFLLFGTRLGRQHLNVVDPSCIEVSVSNAVDVTLGDHTGGQSAKEAIVEHLTSPDDDNDYDDDDAMMTSHAFYNSVSLPNSIAPIYLSSADNSETESVDNNEELEEMSSAAALDEWNAAREQTNSSRRRNDVVVAFRKSPLDGVLSSDRLTESVL